MPRGGTAGGGKRGSSLNFHKPAEPSFLKRFKEKVGFKEKVTTIDDKVNACRLENFDFTEFLQQLYIYYCF